MMTTIWSGLSVGALYGAGGLLFTIPLVRTGIINFAQAFYVILGGYVTYAFQARGWNTLEIVAFLAALGFVLGGLQEVLTVRPVKGAHETTLVTTLGMGVALEGFILAKWGPNPFSASFFGGDSALTLFGGRLQPVDICLILLVIVAGIGFQLAVSGTRWGILGRAAMADQPAAMLRGVNIPRMRFFAFAVAAALACAFAPVAAPKMGVNYQGGLHLAVFSFAALSIGGFGSFTGTVVGGFIMGLVEAFASRYLGVDYVSILIFAILCTVLVVRPTGIFGRRQLRTV
jgi:branched-chain amino acid transport system permease protein